MRLITACKRGKTDVFKRRLLPVKLNRSGEVVKCPVYIKPKNCLTFASLWQRAQRRTYVLSMLILNWPNKLRE